MASGKSCCVRSSTTSWTTWIQPSFLLLQGITRRVSSLCPTSVLSSYVASLALQGSTFSLFSWGRIGTHPFSMPTLMEEISAISSLEASSFFPSPPVLQVGCLVTGFRFSMFRIASFVSHEVRSLIKRRCRFLLIPPLWGFRPSLMRMLVSRWSAFTSFRPVALEGCVVPSTHLLRGVSLSRNVPAFIHWKGRAILCSW